MRELSEAMVSDFFDQGIRNLTGIISSRLDALKVREFFSQLAFKIEISERMQKDLDVYLATGLNIVRNYIQPDENRVSDILRDLLDPSGPHGQGSVFLQSFLETIGVEGMRLHPDSAAIREHYTNERRRLDLLVTFENGAAIGIENKLDAEDQERQVEDYCDYLSLQFPQHILFYLTGDGHDPPPYSISSSRLVQLKAANTLQCISYQNQILRWLEVCLKECKADKIRWFLIDLFDFIEKRFSD